MNYPKASSSQDQTNIIPSNSLLISENDGIATPNEAVPCIDTLLDKNPSLNHALASESFATLMLNPPSPGPVFSKHWPIIIGYVLAYLSDGIGLSVLGPLLLQLGRQIDASTETIASSFLPRAVGYFFGSMAGGFAIDVFRARKGQWALVFAVLLSAFSLLNLAFVQSLWQLMVVSFSHSFAMGAIDNLSHILLMKLCGAAVGPFLQALHGGFAIGAFISPLIASHFVEDDEASTRYKYAFYSLFLLIGFMALYIAILTITGFGPFGKNKRQLNNSQLPQQLPPHRLSQDNHQHVLEFDTTGRLSCELNENDILMSHPSTSQLSSIEMIKKNPMTMINPMDSKDLQRNYMKDQKEMDFHLQNQPDATHFSTDKTHWKRSMEEKYSDSTAQSLEYKSDDDFFHPADATAIPIPQSVHTASFGYSNSLPTSPISSLSQVSRTSLNYTASSSSLNEESRTPTHANGNIKINSKEIHRSQYVDTIVQNEIDVMKDEIDELGDLDDDFDGDDQDTQGHSASPERMSYYGSVRLVLVMCSFLLSCYVGSETALGSFLPTYAVKSNLATESTAAHLSAFFWGSFCLGQIIAIPFSMVIHPRHIVLFSLSCGLLGVLTITAFPEDKIILWGASCFVGFVVSPLYASILTWLEAVVEVSGTRLSLICGIVAACEALFPMFTGFIMGTRFGPHGMMVFLCATMAVCTVLYIIIAIYVSSHTYEEEVVSQIMTELHSRAESIIQSRNTSKTQSRNFPSSESPSRLSRQFSSSENTLVDIPNISNMTNSDPMKTQPWRQMGSIQEVELQDQRTKLPVITSGGSIGSIRSSGVSSGAGSECSSVTEFHYIPRGSSQSDFDG